MATALRVETPPPLPTDPSRRLQLCRECFYRAFEEEVHETIIENKLFSPGERIAVAASGGKDSTVLAHVMTTLNARYRCAAEAGGVLQPSIITVWSRSAAAHQRTAQHGSCCTPGGMWSPVKSLYAESFLR